MLKVPFFEPVQELIEQVEVLMLSQGEGATPELAVALDHLLSSGGKRIRVALTLLSGELLGGDPGTLVTLSAALELLHTATLVHDDLIDGSLLRRGIPTLNAQWSTPATVLTGDFIFARAAKLAADVNLVPVMQLFAQTLAVIVNGELTQMFSRNGLVNREEYEKRIYSKTASLFETAALSSAIISGVSPDVEKQMAKFGYQIGMAFQIVDDVLDFTGKENLVGKPVANDLSQGIVTLPVIHYLEQNKPNQDRYLSILKNVVDGQTVANEDFTGLISSIKGSGSIELAMDEAACYVENSLDILKGFPACQAKHSLEQLAQFIIQRTN